MHHDGPPWRERLRRGRVAPTEEDLQLVGQEGRHALLPLRPVAEFPGAQPLVTHQRQHRFRTQGHVLCG